MNLLKANLSKEKLSEANSIRINKIFCESIIEMIGQTYECVVHGQRDHDKVIYKIGRPGSYNIRGQQMYDLTLTVSDTGVVVSANSFPWSFKKETLRPEYEIYNGTALRITFREGQKDLNQRFKDLNEVIQRNHFPIKL